MPFAFLRFAPLVALALLLGVPGCGDRYNDHDHDHDHEHDHEGHAAHIDPPHWPSDFPDAVDRLVVGQEAARVDLAAGRDKEVRSERVPVLRDLAKWLPEVAGDSDMPEEPWNRVNALSSRLLTIYESLLNDLQAGRSVGVDRLDEAEAVLVELRRERDGAEPNWFPPLKVGGGEEVSGEESPGEPTSDALTGDESEAATEPLPAAS
ncbi:hypothetical protein [Tautonia rosea]|uniref:hypothetical protein n=1 Tax=Tautonia rosea TaxID=2728037 RepID=UPI0014729D7F|nr:hypothetical protein [Tautonia rosea]